MIGLPAAPSETVLLAAAETGRQQRRAVKDKPYPCVKLADIENDAPFRASIIDDKDAASAVFGPIRAIAEIARPVAIKRFMRYFPLRIGNR